MINEVARVRINGELQDALVPDIIDLEVQEDSTAASVFRLRVQLISNPDGSWNYLDDELFKAWNKVAIEIGYPDDTQTIFDGYVTHVEAWLSNSEDCYIEISGMDATARMDLEEKQRAWPNKKDHEIAQAVFADYGFDVLVEDTIFPSQDTVVTTLQSESDIRFLRRLAARNGFECYVDGETGFFIKPNLKDLPQKLLAIEFGPETNMASLRIKLDGTPFPSLQMQRLDPLEKQVDTVELTDSPLRDLGTDTLASLKSALNFASSLVKQAAATKDEMSARLNGAYRPADQFLSVEGEVDSRIYGAVLRSRKLVTIKGAGERFSGMYYVTKVTHRLSAEGYTQRFEAYRNGVGLTGSENFSAASVPAAVSGGFGAAGAAGLLPGGF